MCCKGWSTHTQTGLPVEIEPIQTSEAVVALEKQLRYEFANANKEEEIIWFNIVGLQPLSRVSVDKEEGEVAQVEFPKKVSSDPATESAYDNNLCSEQRPYRVEDVDVDKVWKFAFRSEAADFYALVDDRGDGSELRLSMIIKHHFPPERPEVLSND